MGALGDLQKELEILLADIKQPLIGNAREVLKEQLVTEVWGYYEELAKFFHQNKAILDKEQYEYLCSFPDAMIEEILNEVMK